MKRFAWFYALVAALAILWAVPAFATDWTLLYQDAEEDGDLLNLHPVDESTLFFASDNLHMEDVIDLGTYQWVLKSTDGGASLDVVYFFDMSFADLYKSAITVRDIYMMNDMQGYICGMYATSLFSMGPWVGATLDGGLSWEKRETFPAGLLDAYELNTVDFMSETKGFAFGTPKHSYTTDDAGATWTKLPNIPSYYYDYNEYVDQAYDGAGGIYIVGSYTSSSYSYNGGDDDDDDDTGDDDDDETDSKDAKEGDLDDGDYGELLYSSDNGNSWTVVATYEDAGYLQAGFPHVEFYNQDLGWVTIVGYKPGPTPATDIVYTHDGGTTWEAGVLPSEPGGRGEPGEYLIYDVAFLTEDYGWAVGYNAYTLASVILHSDDGGKNWAFDDYAGLGKLRVIEFLDNRHGWAVGGNMTVVSFLNLENNVPIADAGTDRNVNPGATLNLDGTGSTDPDGDTLTYLWELTSGETVILDDPTSETPSFTAPDDNATLVFELVVTDELLLASDPDEVVITVGEGDPSDDDDDDDTVDDDDAIDPGADVFGEDDDDDESCCG